MLWAVDVLRTLHDFFFLGSDFNTLFHFLQGVQQGLDDYHVVQKVKRDAMKRVDVLSTPDDTVASVKCKDDDGGNRRFQGPMQVGEALDVQHGDFINKKHSWKKLSNAQINILITTLLISC